MELIVTLRQFLERLESEHHKESATEDVGGVPIANLVTSIPSDHHRLLRKIGAAYRSANHINSSVVFLPGNAIVILFDSGILPFLSSLNKILLSQLDSLGFEPTMEFEVAASRAISVVKSFCGEEERPCFSISPRRTSIVSSLSSVQTSFVMGHEFSHVVLGHYSPGSERTQSVLQEREYAADAHGAELAITSWKNACDPPSGGFRTAMIQAGIDIFFTYYIFVNDVTGSMIQGDTHPTIEQRRSKLREKLWDEMPEDARALASSAERLFDSFRTTLALAP